MHKKRAFTLIELLVVIAIIALLMSILMPALAKAKKQALAVACMARGHQTAVSTSTYTSDNNGYFHMRVGVGTERAYRQLWPYVYKPYYKEAQMRFCPTATNPKRYTGPFGTWNYGLGSYHPIRSNCPMPGEREFDPFDAQTYVDGYFTGSIGINRYVVNMGGSFSTDTAFWRTTDIKGADRVPVFVDCQYLSFWPNALSPPPTYDGEFTYEMQWPCINRHMGYVNVVFADWSVRKVGLKELWTLKWHRTYDTCGPWTTCGGVVANDWPKWMRGFKDF